MTFAVATAVSLVLLAAARPLRGQISDEVDVFRPPAKTLIGVKDDKEIKDLWRLLRIGDKFDRRDIRGRVIALDRPLATILHADLIGTNADASRNAAMILARAGDRGALADLRAIVQGTTKELQRHAVMALGLLGDHDDVEALIKLLKSSRRPEIRRAVLYALGWLARPEDVVRFADVFETDNSQELRAALMLCLGRVGGADALKFVQKGLEQRKESIRRSATIALADIGGPEVLPHLRARLTDTDDAVVKSAALGLAMVRADGVVAIIESQDLLRHKRDEVRAAAVTGLGMQDSPRAREVLVNWLRTTDEREKIVKQATAFALTRLGSSGSKEFTQLVADLEPDVLRAAAVAARADQNAGALFGGARELLHKRFHESVRRLGLLLFARSNPDEFKKYAEQTIAANDDKKGFLEAVLELKDVVLRPATRTALLDARIQVIVDDLGGSPDWQVLSAIHKDMMAIEHIDGSITPRGSGTAPGASGGGADPSRPKQDRWTEEEEDMRLWYDAFPYFDRRKSNDRR